MQVRIVWRNKRKPEKQEPEKEKKENKKLIRELEKMKLKYRNIK